MKLELLLCALERRGCKPLEVSPGRWLALCPCCGRLDLAVERDGVSEAPTKAERNIWLAHWRRS